MHSLQNSFIAFRIEGRLALGALLAFSSAIKLPFPISNPEKQCDYSAAQPADEKRQADSRRLDAHHRGLLAEAPVRVLLICGWVKLPNEVTHGAGIRPDCFVLAMAHGDTLTRSYLASSRATTVVSPIVQDFLMLLMYSQSCTTMSSRP
jgi:hypothetical protein